jgi:hypothetical protein
MHKRPRLQEAINVLENLSLISADAKSAVEQYYEMRSADHHFEACRMVVDIVDHHYHNMSIVGAVNG